GPTVTSVSSTADNGTYGIGSVIPITVTFDESVIVTGTPQLTLETGDTDVVVDYSSGSGSSILTFNYTVASGHTSGDLDYGSTSALALNSGTIKDAVGNTATLTFASPGATNSLGANKAIVIDWRYVTGDYLYFNYFATFESPACDNTLEVGQTYTIKWRTNVASDWDVYLYYFSAGVSGDYCTGGEHPYGYDFSTAELIVATLNTGSYDFIIPDYTIKKGHFVIKFVSPSGSNTAVLNNMAVTIIDDKTPPTFTSNYPTISDILGTSFKLKIKSDETGVGYYVLLPDGSTAPTSTEVKAGTGSGGASAVSYGSKSLTASTEAVETIVDLTSETSYDIYVVMEDAKANLQSSPTKLDVRTPDITAPTISSVSLSSNSHVNHTKVSYTLSEAAASGTITWIRTGGSADSNSPHAQALAGDELNTGAHTDITLTNNPTLVDGAIYTISFDAKDAAGNVATTVSANNVTYDVSPSTITNMSIIDGDYVGSREIIFVSDELTTSGTVTFTRTGGSEDAGSPHSKTIEGPTSIDNQYNGYKYLMNTVVDFTSLVDAAIYTVNFSVTDLAGNQTSIDKKNVTYDNTPPVSVLLSPTSNSYTKDAKVSYSLSENAKLVRFYWNNTNSSLGDSWETELTGDNLKAGDHIDVELNPQVTDGQSYHINM
ncbi:uncharacterized protein METZ01_LOCUS175828, partial [marine metagenome]